VNVSLVQFIVSVSCVTVWFCFYHFFYFSLAYPFFSLGGGVLFTPADPEAVCDLFDFKNCYKNRVVVVTVTCEFISHRRVPFK
jgi:hypothetical protein